MINASMFKKPSAEYGIHPFWFWNGDMEEEQIRLQIAEMAEKGLGGFLLCARQGITIPYLSDAWFDKVKLAIDVAEQHGLHVWLYDEYPYPSGIAGGEVILEHPDAKHCTLEYKGALAANGQEIDLELPWGRTVSATAIPLDPVSGTKQWDRQIDISSSIGNFQADPVFQKTGLTAYNNKRYFTYRTIKKLRWKAPAGNWEIHVFMEAEIPDYKYYGTFVDFGHEEAMRTFIRLTHERYRQEVGHHFGKTVKGMFTDETGYLGRVPWSPFLPQRFLDMNGYDLKKHLPALIDNDYKDAAKIRYDLFQAANDILRETYHKLCSDWCVENGLEYVAEVPAVRMTTQLYSHVVGSDSAHEKLGRSLEWVIDRYYANFRSNPKMTSSLARQLGCERALCECFHSIGWSMTLQDAKWMIDRMAAMGINFYNFHSFFYTLDGLAKHDAPPSQFLQNPYWRHFAKLSDYVSRISYIMTKGSAVRDIALVDPTTSFWTHLGNPIYATAKGFSYIGYDVQEEERLEQLKLHWGEIGKQLLLDRIDYDHLDPEFFERAEIRDGRLYVGTAAYSTLILPPMSNLESSAWTKIKQFASGGGTVIAVGLLPYEKIQDDSPSEAEILAFFGIEKSFKEQYWQGTANGTNSLPWVKGERSVYFIQPSDAADLSLRLVLLLQEITPPKVRLGDGNSPRSFLIQERDMGDSHVVFVSNQEGEQLELPLFVAADLLGETTDAISFRSLDLETGEYLVLACQKDQNGWIIPLTFAPYQSHLIEIGCLTLEVRVDGGSSDKVWDIELDASGLWDVTAKQPNVIRFDSFDLSITDEKGNSTASSKVEVKTFIDQCADIAQQPNVNIPLEFDQFFGTPKKIKLQYPLSCSYNTEFIVETLPEQCELFMDKGAISGEFVLRINGKQLNRSDFEEKFIYDHANVACQIRPFLKEGINQLTVELTLQHDWDGVIDALYVQGDFGVSFKDQKIAVMSKPAKQVPLTGGPSPSFPYYAGTLSYKKSFDVNPVKDKGAFELHFKNWDNQFHDCAEVKVNGQLIGVRAWSPYLWKGESTIWKQGINVVEVKVTNSLAGLLDGKYFDYKSHELREVTTLI